MFTDANKNTDQDYQNVVLLDDSFVKDQISKIQQDDNDKSVNLKSSNTDEVHSSDSSLSKINDEDLNRNAERNSNHRSSTLLENNYNYLTLYESKDTDSTADVKKDDTSVEIAINCENMTIEKNSIADKETETLEEKDKNTNSEDKKLMSTYELESELQKRNQLYEITQWNYFFIALSLGLYTIDILSDLILGIRYFIGKQWVYAALTLFFVNGSSIFYNLFNKNAAWYVHDFK